MCINHILHHTHHHQIIYQGRSLPVFVYCRNALLIELCNTYYALAYDAVLYFLSVCSKANIHESVIGRRACKITDYCSDI